MPCKSSFSKCCGLLDKPDYLAGYRLQSFTYANGVIPVTKYVSESTGLTVVHAVVEGPMVNCYICVATRAEDDDGLAHTLEHLVFLGSEDYPFKGVLDRVANKCYASGTNAWTDVDHTCYTLSTAGVEGFSRILPLYLDHIFHPRLAESAFITEVHHVTGHGTDGGVVYSEMQSHENTGFCRASNELFKTIYPPESGYHWNVGGALQNLRDSCNNAKVRAFHERYYHPGNSCIIVCGPIELQELFRVIHPAIKQLNLKAESSGRNKLKQVSKPWINEDLNPCPNVTSPITKTIKFPACDEEGGAITIIGFLGPSITAPCFISEDKEEVCVMLNETFALLLLMKYLAKSPVSPLQQDLVESGQLASSLSFTFAEYSETLFYLELDGVINKENLVPQIRSTLQNQLQSFDVRRMRDIIHSTILSELAAMENVPHSYIATAVIHDFLYGVSSATFDKRLNCVNMLSDLMQKPDSFWTDLLKMTILTSEWVTIFAVPSTSLHQTLESQDQARIRQRKQELRTKGLKQNAEDLKFAISKNCKPIPKKLLEKVKVPSIKTINYHKIDRLQNPLWIFMSDFPANCFIDDVATKFFYAVVLLDTSKLGAEFRPYLPLFREVLLNSPVLTEDPGKPGISKKPRLIPYEEVISARERDVIVCELNLGLELPTGFDDDDGGAQMRKFICGSYSHLLCLVLQMNLERIEEGMMWIKKLLWSVNWQMERIKVVASKLLSDVFYVRRYGCQMCEAIIKQLIYRKNSNVATSSPLFQQKFLQDLGAEDERVMNSKENDIRTAFDSILSVVTDPKNVTLHCSGNMKKIRNKLDTMRVGNFSTLLSRCFPFEVAPGKVEKRLARSPDTVWMYPTKKLIEESLNNQIIFGLGAEESSYLCMVSQGPTSFLHNDYAALLTTIQYFCQLEGPLYRKIRGKGLAYSYNICAKVTEGLIYFNLSRCTNLVDAYGAAHGVFTDHTAKSSKWSEDLLISARSSLIFESLETEKTPLSVAANSCLSYYRGVPGTYVKDLIAKISKVKMTEVKDMKEKYLAPLFGNSNYATVIVCPNREMKIIRDGLAPLGRRHFRGAKSFEDLSNLIYAA